MRTSRLFAPPLLVAGLLAGGPISPAVAQAAPAPQGTASLSGQVLDRVDGTAVAGACVSVSNDHDTVFEEVRTDSGGQWTIAELPAGSYLVVFEDCTQPWTYITQAWEDTAFDAAEEPSLVVVADGENATGINARLERGTQSYGTLVAEHTLRPVHDVCVGLYSVGDRTAPVHVTTTGITPDGETRDGYVFGGVRPGRYDIVSNQSVCGDDGYSQRILSNDREIVDPWRSSAGVVVTPQPSTQVACGELDASQPALFADVEGGVHRLAVECLSEFEVVKGRAPGRFDPTASVRRDQMAAFVARALQALGVALPAAPQARFTDVAGNTHERAILQLAELGVVSGRSDGRYAPEEPVTRGQTATLLVNAYEQATGYELREGSRPFRDDAGTHQSSIRKAALAGMVAGTGNGTTFSPQLPVRRDQTATFVARAMDRVLRDTYRTDAP